MKLALTIAGILVAAGVGETYAAPISSSTYAAELIRRVTSTHAEVLDAAVEVTPPKASQLLIVAASDPGKIGHKAGPADEAVMRSGQLRVSRAADRLEVHLPLRDVSGDTLGVLVLTYASADDANRKALEKDAEGIRDMLQRRISHVANLLEPYPYVPNAPGNTYAQQLVDQTMERHPEIEILALHAMPPGGGDNIIVGSNIGRIGKKADEDDMRVVNTGKPNLEVNEDGKRFEVEMQLHDRAGNNIGAVSTVFAYKRGDDRDALRHRGESINAELQKKIPDAASLFRPVQ